MKQLMFNVIVIANKSSVAYSRDQGGHVAFGHLKIYDERDV